MIKKIFIILSLFYLGSCIVQTGFKPYVISENVLIEQRFPDNKKALIITSDVDGVSNASSLWYKINEKTGNYNSSNYIWISRSKNKQILMLEPGTYSLKRFETQNNSHVRSWVETNKKLYNPKTKEPALASFTVKAGEIVYLGDIKFSSYVVGRKKLWSNQRDTITRINISNNFRSAKGELRYQYPKFKNRKIVTRIIKVNEKNK